MQRSCTSGDVALLNCEVRGARDVDAICVGARPRSLDVDAFGVASGDILEVDVYLCAVHKVYVPRCHIAALVNCHCL